jgi:hypothetical protein
MSITNRLKLLSHLADNSIETCITIKPNLDGAIWGEVLRVIKPGGSMMILTKEICRVACSIEDAGWGVRDTITSITSHGMLFTCWAMKPIEGTFVQNAGTWGIAGLNIDKSRIPHITVENGSLAYNPHLRKSIAGGNGGKIIATEKGRRFNIPHTGGRWPTNVILWHTPQCAKDGIKHVKNSSGSVGGHEPSHTGDHNTNCYGVYNRKGFSKYGDAGVEVVEKWNCSDDCPVKALSEQSRYFYSVQSLSELLDYLCIMTSPPGDSTVIDPFGSDEVKVAVVRSGREFIGV